MKKILLGIALALLAAPAFAATCPSYPYTLTNGQTADATQVMANFTSILTCANTNVARAGANSDITSISGLLTPLAPSQGGTGQTTSIFSSNNTWAGTNAFGTATWTPFTINLTGPVTGTASVAGAATVNIATTRVPAYVQVQNQRPSGTLSGSDSFNASAWHTMVLNTTLSNTVSGASLGANLVTLPAGTYEFRFSATGVTGSSTGDIVSCRAYNNTDSAVLVRGLDAGIANASQNASFSANGVFVLAGAKAVALQCHSSNNTITVGVGSSGAVPSDGTPEAFADLVLVKLD
jgi:hypothetical protein